MGELELALAAAWIGRLGKRRVAELAHELQCGPTVAERSRAIAESVDVSGLAEILLNGLRHHVHQTVYVRLSDEGDNAERLTGLQVGDGDRVTVRRVIEDAPDRVRMLLFASREMEFLPPDDAPFTVDIAYPVMVRSVGDRVVVHVMTVQNSPTAWGEIVGQPVRRALNYVGGDKIHDQVLDYLREAVHR